MGIKRTELIDILKRVSPALSNKELVPAFSNFFFDGETCTAFDGIVAITTGCKQDQVKGGLRGRLLLDFLGVCRAAEVEFVPEELKCTVKAGRAKLALAMDPWKDLSFKWPDDKGVSVEFSDAFMAALVACSATLGLDPSNPALMGITIEVEPDQLVLYSSTNLSMTSCVVKAKPPKSLVGKAIVLPVRFCELLLARTRPKTIAITPEWVEARYEDGTRLHSASVGAADTKLFRKVLDRIEWKDFVKVPKGLEGCIARALVVLSSDETQHSELLVKDARLRFKTTGPGEVCATDFVDVGTHQPVEIRVRPSLLTKPLEHAATLRIFPSCFAFSGPNYRSMVSVASA